MAAPLLELRNISYDVVGPNGVAVNVLDSISFDVTRGETIAIVGPSGSGKSSILAIAGLMEAPTAGEIHIDGIDVGQYSDAQRAQLRAEKFGFVFQNFSLQRHMSCVANVELPLLYRDVARNERQSRAVAMLEQVGLGDRVLEKPKALSGGEQQRVAIARALVSRPEVIFADEPTAALDHATGTTVFDVMLREIESRSCSLVVVSHDPRIADRCDRVLQLRDGSMHG